MNYRIIISAIFVSCLSIACDSKLNVPKGEESKFLFATKSAQVLGDVTGNLVLNANAIHIHPGATTPTSVSFNLNGKFNSITYKPYIAKLNAEGLQNLDAGIVGVEVVIDGKSRERMKIDRTTNIEKKLELNGAKLLVFQVDNGNGTPAWDWFEIKITSIE